MQESLNERGSLFSTIYYLFYLLSFSLKNRLYSPVFQISNPAGQSQTLSQLSGPVPVKNTLDSALNIDVGAYYRRFHLASQMCFSKSTCFSSLKATPSE